MIYVTNDYIQHSGIKGQRWGIRRFQNEDGSLTPAGEERYRRKEEKRTIRNEASVLARARKKDRRAMDLRISSEKGPEYANKVHKQVVAKRLTHAAIKTAAIVGAAIVTGKLASHTYRNNLALQNAVTNGQILFEDYLLSKYAKKSN